MSSNGTALVRQVDTVAAAPLAPRAQAFEPSSVEDALRLSKLLVASHMLPRSIATPEAAFAVILTGRELGLTAMQALRSIHIIEGRPTLSADLIASLVKSRSDTCEWFRLVESTAEAATYETKRRGEPSPTRMSFTSADAKRAGVDGKDNWRKYPAAMLRARCITALARAVYPDLVLGVYDPDELAPAVEPAPSGATYEVVRTTRDATPPPAPAEPAEPVVDAEDGIAEAVAACHTAAELNALAKDAAKAHKLGQLDDAAIARVAAAVKARRAELAAANGAPPAPASSPEVAS